MKRVSSILFTLLLVAMVVVAQAPYVTRLQIATDETVNISSDSDTFSVTLTGDSTLYTVYAAFPTDGSARLNGYVNVWFTVTDTVYLKISALPCRATAYSNITNVVTLDYRWLLNTGYDPDSIAVFADSIKSVAAITDGMVVPLSGKAWGPADGMLFRVWRGVVPTNVDSTGGALSVTIGVDAQ